MCEIGLRAWVNWGQRLDQKAESWGLACFVASGYKASTIYQLRPPRQSCPVLKVKMAWLYPFSRCFGRTVSFHKIIVCSLPPIGDCPHCFAVVLETSACHPGSGFVSKLGDEANESVLVSITPADGLDKRKVLCASCQSHLWEWPLFVRVASGSIQRADSQSGCVRAL